MFQPSRDVLEQPVADMVAERIVDDFEAVEIHEQDSYLLVLPGVASVVRPSPKHLIECGAKHASVRETREGVLGCKPSDVGLRFLLSGLRAEDTLQCG